jgi:hypothetical protein
LAAWVATAGLGFVGTYVGRWPEVTHAVGHLVLCGGTAWIAALAARGDDVRRAVIGGAAGMAVGVGIELLQLRYHPPAVEVAYDLWMDGLGAAVGLLLFGGRSVAVHRALGFALHPLLVAPSGFVMLVISETGRVSAALAWAAAAALALSPAIAAWLWARWSGRAPDLDLSRRADRPVVFALGAAGLLTFAVVGQGGPASVARVSAVAAVGAAAGAVVTWAGAKPSGHVGIPAALATLAVGHSPRAVTWLAGVALVLAIARVVGERHTVAQVLGGVGLGVGAAAVFG